MYRLVIGVVLALVLLPAYAQGADVVRVGAGGDYPTLGEALAVVRPGATIEVLPGVQTGQWSIGVPLTLRGQSGAVLDGAGKGTLLTIAADGVTVEGLVIRNSGRSLLNDDAALRVVGDDAHVVHNRIEDIHHAIYVTDGAARAVVRDNRISGRAALVPEDRGNGIHLWNAPDALVEGNEIEDVRDGVYVGFAPRSVFRLNVLRRVRYGIHFMYADDNRFEENTFEQSEAGAALMYSQRITIRRNVFAHSRSNRAYGLLLQECDQVVAEDNVLLDNSRALFVNVTRDSVFQHNVFAANDLAVRIYAASTGNRFEGNDFIANMQLVELDQVGKNVWERNFWQEYRGLDDDGDGYGDVVFRTGDPLGTLLTDYPQLRLFRYSPAAQALEVGERAFPVMVLPQIVDAHPAMSPVAQRTGRLPPLPQAPVGGALLVPALVVLLAALALVWYGSTIARSARWRGARGAGSVGVRFFGGREGVIRPRYGDATEAGDD